MKTLNTLNITAVLLVMASGISACKKEHLDPAKDILGKWELVGYMHYGSDEPELIAVPSLGYVEYLSDGRVRWYDYAEEEYTMEGTYSLENRTEVEFSYWHLCFLNKEFYHQPNSTNFDENNYKCEFVSKDEKYLYGLDLQRLTGSRDVYKRKK